MVWYGDENGDTARRKVQGTLSEIWQPNSQYGTKLCKVALESLCETLPSQCMNMG